MSYFFTTIINNCTIKQAKDKIADELKKVGFGIISEINMSGILKKKIDVDFKNYVILGACNPHHAYHALKEEDKIGLFLPCNIVISEEVDGSVQVSAIDPISAMSSVRNEKLEDFAEKVRQSISTVITNLA